MRSTLFHIPTTLPWGDSSVPLFGAGAMLVIWGLIAAAWFAWIAARSGPRVAAGRTWLPVVVVGLMLGWVLPLLAEDGGIPVRGYGVMLLLAALLWWWLGRRPLPATVEGGRR